MTVPKRAHQFICSIGSDTKEALIAELEGFIRRIDGDQITRAYPVATHKR